MEERAVSSNINTRGTSLHMYECSRLDGCSPFQFFFAVLTYNLFLEVLNAELSQSSNQVASFCDFGDKHSLFCRSKFLRHVHLL
jgi:hypothetical protein